MTKTEITKHNADIQNASLSGLYEDACLIIDKAQQVAYHAVNETLIKRNWLLGMRIRYEVLKEQRAEYGKQVIKILAEKLVKKYGRGFSMRNLYYFTDFYQSHPDFFQLVVNKSEIDPNESILQSLLAKYDTILSLFGQLSVTKILQSLTAKSPIHLSWTHYSIILQETTAKGRAWYENEAAKEM